MPNEVKLLPCPFCGGMAIWPTDKSRVQCRACGVLGPFNYNKADAIAGWNTRPTTVVTDEVELLKRISRG